ncbi:MAG: recombinase family protein [Clostridia bacterium]|nr:recombinase family protein [Clostridia bacterium]
MNVAIYLRKSRADENNPHETLERHKEILLDYAQENNLTVIDIFEEVISGGLLFNRTEMLKLLDNIPKHLYDAVLCIDLDRLGRGSAADSEKIFDTLKEYDIKIITLKKIYDLNNEYDEDYSEFEMFMARKELKFITRRMNRGRVKSINEGCFVSGAPFGYRNTVVNKKHTLEIYEPEAQYVRMIFDLYVNQNQGITAISHILEQLGVKSKKGTPLNRSTISRILKNHTYIGDIVWNKSKSVKGENKQFKTEKSNWLCVKGLHEPIIKEELFYQAQELIEQRYKPPVNRGTLKNPLAGIVKCANCGKTMVTNTSAETIERYRLICRTPSCNKASALSIVENRLLEEIRKEMSHMEVIISGDKKSKEDKDRRMYLDRIEFADAELKKLEKQQLKLYDLLEQGVYSKELFLERNKNITERRAKLNDMISDAQEHINNIGADSVEFKLPLFREVIENYHKLDIPQKNALLKDIIEKVEYRREKDAPEGDIHLKMYYK